MPIAPRRACAIAAGTSGRFGCRTRGSLRVVVTGAGARRLGRPRGHARNRPDWGVVSPAVFRPGPSRPTLPRCRGRERSPSRAPVLRRSPAREPSHCLVCLVRCLRRCPAHPRRRRVPHPSHRRPQPTRPPCPRSPPLTASSGRRPATRRARIPERRPGSAPPRLSSYPGRVTGSAARPGGRRPGSGPSEGGGGNSAAGARRQWARFPAQRQARPEHGSPSAVLAARIAC